MLNIMFNFPIKVIIGSSSNIGYGKKTIGYWIIINHNHGYSIFKFIIFGFFFPWLRLWRRPDGYEQLLTLRIQAGDGPKRSVPAGEGEVVK